MARLNGHEFEQVLGVNTGLDEAKAGIRIAGRNINNLRYADDITHKQNRAVILERLN